EHEHHHHHHDDDDDDEHEHEHHHHHDDDDDDEHEHHHHHHEDGEECDDPDCACHHHDHDADEVFTSWGTQTVERFTEEKIGDLLDELVTGRFGAVLRAKGIVQAEDGGWIHFDYVPGEKEVRRGAADVTGKLCVIGSGLDKKALSELFRAE
ncbi:MAG: GTP-binding protein, partial [Clostridia bacterium]|nr:GTP-binding protein [Clostridia bacterium]